MLVRSDVYCNRTEVICQPEKWKIKDFFEEAVTGKGRICAYPLRDVQRETPVDVCWCCGGELYGQDPALWIRGARICTACAEESQRMKEIKPEDEAV